MTPTISADVLAEVDSDTGTIRELIRFDCMHWSECPSEHHGGNPVVGPDDSVYVPIGDWDLPFLYAQRPDWPAGKIHRVQPDGTSTMFALGFRNPFDLIVDAETGTLIVPETGLPPKMRSTSFRSGTTPAGHGPSELSRHAKGCVRPLTSSRERPRRPELRP